MTRPRTRGSDDPFRVILASLHDAALEYDGWTSAACLVNDVVGTKGNCLAFGEGRPGVDEIISFVRICAGGRRREDRERRYFESYYHQDERVPLLGFLPPGQLLYNNDVYSADEKKHSPVYNELLLDFEAQEGLQMRLGGPEPAAIVWMFADSVERGGWTTDQVRMITALQPHVRQFVRVREALADTRALAASLTSLLDHSRLGVIPLDRRGRIEIVNDRAHELLREGRRLFDAKGYLYAQEPKQNLELQRLLARALTPGKSPRMGGTMTVGDPSTGPSLVLHIHPVGGRRWRHVSAKQVAVLVLIVDPARPARIEPSLVAAAMGLTDHQGEVAVMLANGHSAASIAEATGRSITTVRWHVRQIFSALGITRQAELVRRVLSLDGIPFAGRRTHESDSDAAGSRVSRIDP